MLKFLKKKSPTEKLQKRHKQLLEQAYKLSQTDRTAGDQKYAEAEEIMQQIEQLGKK